MLPDWVSNPGPLTYESGALPIVLPGPAMFVKELIPTAKGCKNSYSSKAVHYTVYPNCNGVQKLFQQQTRSLQS